MYLVYAIHKTQGFKQTCIFLLVQEMCERENVLYDFLNYTKMNM